MEIKRIAFGLCGSFCTFEAAIGAMEKLKQEDYEILPVMSFAAYETDTRFGAAQEHIRRIETISGRTVLHTLTGAEPIGPKNLADIMLIAPCTGTSMAKLALGIADTPVLLAAKSMMRNGKPVVVALASNDVLGNNAKNLGHLMNTPHVFFVPLTQDDATHKPNSMIARFELVSETVASAWEGKQLRPIFI